MDKNFLSLKDLTIENTEDKKIDKIIIFVAFIGLLLGIASGVLVNII